MLDEDLEVGSDHSSDTESIDTRGGTSDAAGEAEVVSVPEAPVPTVSVPVERFTDSFQWLGEVDLEVVFKQRPCLMKSVPGFMKGGVSVCHARCVGRVEKMQPGHHGVGSCSSCSLVCCCTSPREAVWCPRGSCKTDSRCLLTGIGPLFSLPAWNRARLLGHFDLGQRLFLLRPVLLGPGAT